MKNSLKKTKSNFKLYVLIFGIFTLTTLFILSIPVLAGLSKKEEPALVASDQVIANLIPKAPVDAKEVKAKVVSRNLPIPTFSAQAVLAQDLDTGYIYFQKNINQKLSPASTTKLMTALVATEHFKSGDILVVGPSDTVGGSTMELKIGERVTFRALLYGMLLNSGNDAAYTIASNYPGGREVFVAKMNLKAKELGLNSTNFQNPAGFDQENHYSSAADLVKLAKVVANDVQLSVIVATKETLVSNLETSEFHNLKNLNKLLDKEGFLGIKTGFTEKSGENFIGLVNRDGHKVLTVVLNSKDRFGETSSLIDWIYANFSWE